MTKNKFSIIILCLSLGVLCGCTDDDIIVNADEEVQLYFDTTEATQEISPYIYGTFIEHIETCIYQGIWSELISDRKFYDPVGQGVSQWMANGNVSMETVETMKDKYAVKLSSGSSIYQRGIALDVKEYSGYFYAIGYGTIVIKFTHEENEIIKEITIASNTYEKYQYNFVSTFKTSRARISIESTEGTIIIDSVSLMPSDNYFGMRKDTLEQLKALNATFYRWPGGNFVSGYDWKDGIGDRDYRSTKRNLNYCGLESDYATEEERIASDIIKIGQLTFYGAFEPNDFGIDEFILMCRYLNAEPNIVVNSGLGNADDAADIVEYCNTNNTEYGKMRIQNEPYSVKYFSIGNEMNGSWQLGHVAINEYKLRHNEFFNKMKAVDSSIEIIGVGDNVSNWSSEMISNCTMNYISEHFYGERDESNHVNHIKSLKAQAEMRINKHRQLNTDITMAIDEYAYLNANEISRLKDGMGVALVLNTYIKNSDVVTIACYSSTINATQGSIKTDKFDSYMEGNGYALMLYRNNLFNIYQPVRYQMPKIDGEVFEVVATYDKQTNQLSLAITNSSEKTIQLSSSNFKKIISRKYVTSNFLDDYNSSDGILINYIEDVPNGIIVEGKSISVIKVQL